MLALILAAALAQAAPPSAPVAAKPSVITQPDWVRKPDVNDLMRYFPKAAQDARIGGRAILHCSVDASGALTECTATEDPPGYGFAQAAIGMATIFKMRPQTKDGQPIAGGRINIPIRFDTPKENLPSVTLATRCYGFAAAAAERDPSSQEAQVAVLAWRMVLMVRSYPEHQRPSEFDQMLVELRQSAMPKLDDAAFKTDRDECAAQVKPTAANLRDLESMARE